MKRKGNDRDAKSKRLIRRAYKRYDGKYGYRQLQLFLWQDDGVWMNHKKVLRLMQKLGLQASIRRKRRFNMTYQAAERVAENMLNRNFTAEKPNQ
ncbi:IS3 family transposase, partial [Paenibacillus lautus]|uniref:IS3 family transposase n=1 Tax=Paenibacillus lautus TaxID=1401 RepID=UPI001C0F3F4A